MIKFWWNRIMRWAMGTLQKEKREEGEEEGRKRGRNVSVVSGRLVPRCLVPSWISCYYWFWPSVLVAKGAWASMGHDVPEDGKGRGHSIHLELKNEIIWSCRVSCAMESTVQVLSNHPFPFLHWVTSGFAVLRWLHSLNVQIWILAIANRLKACY